MAKCCVLLEKSYVVLQIRFYYSLYIELGL